MDSRSSLPELKATVLDGMVAFLIEDPDCGYDRADVERCGALLDRYLDAVSGSPGTDRVQTELERVVLRLNQLNEACDHCLIETDQREDLCALLLEAARRAGWRFEGDPTEEWREW